MPTMSTTQTIGVRRMRLKSMYVRGFQPRPSCSLSHDSHTRTTWWWRFLETVHRQARRAFSAVERPGQGPCSGASRGRGPTPGRLVARRALPGQE